MISKPFEHLGQAPDRVWHWLTGLQSPLSNSCDAISIVSPGVHVIAFHAGGGILTPTVD